jgi:hypothetical protein
MHRLLLYSKAALVAVGMVHLVALGGVFAFARIKEGERRPDTDHPQKSAAKTVHQPSKQKEPKRD